MPSTYDMLTRRHTQHPKTETSERQADSCTHPPATGTVGPQHTDTDMHIHVHTREHTQTGLQLEIREAQPGQLCSLALLPPVPWLRLVQDVFLTAAQPCPGGCLIGPLLLGHTVLGGGPVWAFE
ncbi:hypothetical protein AAY473_034623 [Plecturocebus cupreus]